MATPQAAVVVVVPDDVERQDVRRTGQEINKPQMNVPPTNNLSSRLLLCPMRIHRYSRTTRANASKSRYRIQSTLISGIFSAGGEIFGDGTMEGKHTVRHKM